MPKQTVQVNQTNNQAGPGVVKTEDWGDAMAFGNQAAANVGQGVKGIVRLTSVEYAALTSPDPLILYLVPEA